MPDQSQQGRNSFDDLILPCSDARQRTHIRREKHHGLSSDPVHPRKRKLHPRSRACQQVVDGELKQIVIAESCGDAFEISRDQIPRNEMAIDGAFAASANCTREAKLFSDLWHYFLLLAND